MTAQPAHPRVLVVRNDKLGDFMLAYPSFALLKRSLPNTAVYALVPEYTREMAELCPWIDHVITDPGPARGLKALIPLVQKIHHFHLDAVITLFSTTRTGLAVGVAGIPLRLAPATKLAQLFYNHRLHQRRSRSEKPEFEYNLDLVRHYLTLQNCESAEIQPPYLHFADEEIAQLKQRFCNTNKLEGHRPIVFIHPGHGGSANNLSLHQYAQLAKHLHTKHGANIIITAGPNELEQAQQLISLTGVKPSAVYHSMEGLKQFAQHIQFADVFISGSTGPLHVAGALNTPTAAFYTRRQSATALRWQTLNTPDKRLAFSPPPTAEECDMDSINIDAAATLIGDTYLNTL